MTHTVIGVKLPPGGRGTPGASVVPDRTSDDGGATTMQPVDVAAEAAGPRPLVLVRSSMLTIRRIAAPTR